MKYDAVLTEDVHRKAREFLLRHIVRGKRQEDLCFALWRPGTGATRTSALVFELILPEHGERDLHRNASFDASYLSRAVRTALKAKAGVAFMHSHLTPGWQKMSGPDIVAERDRIAPPARAAGFPAVGLTLGTDGAWSARFWIRDGGKFRRKDCGKVRVVGARLRITRHPRAARAAASRRFLRRTISTWGKETQADLASLRIGIVGVGSVGCLVAESLARMGVRRIALFDADRVEPHNLDRLLYGSRRDVGRYKVLLAADRLRRSATASDFRVEARIGRIEERDCFRAALDCDLLFAAVDRPLPKDLLNHLAYAHAIPVIFGGVYAAPKAGGKMGQAVWSVVTASPGQRCLRCDGQYTTSEVVMERDGSLDDPTYIRNLGGEAPVAAGQNVFPFSANLASFMALEMIRMVAAEDWWPELGKKMEFRLIPGRFNWTRARCTPHCAVRPKTALGDAAPYPLLSDPPRRASAFASQLRDRAIVGRNFLRGIFGRANP